MSQPIEYCQAYMLPETLSAWHDRELNAEMAQQVQQHVVTCPACQAYLADYEADGRTIRRFDPPQMQDAIWGDVQQETLHATPRRPLKSQNRLLLGSISVALALVLLFTIIAVTQLGHHGPATTLVPLPTSTIMAINGTNPTGTVANTPTTVTTSTSTPVMATATMITQPTTAPKAVFSMKEVSQSLTITNSSAMDYSVSVSCPTGQTMLGGGYSIAGDSNAQKAILLASYPATTNTWTATETNPAGGAMTLSAYAECLTSNFPVTTEIAQAVIGLGCPKNDTLIGGGFKQDHNGASVVYNNGSPGGPLWEASQYQPTGSLITYAVCMVPNRFTTTDYGAFIAVSSGATGDVTAVCPTGDIVTEGGYNNEAFDPVNYYRFLSSHTANGVNEWTVTITNIGGPTPGERIYNIAKCLSITS